MIRAGFRLLLLLSEASVTEISTGVEKVRPALILLEGTTIQVELPGSFLNLNVMRAARCLRWMSRVEIGEAQVTILHHSVMGVGSLMEI
jgi:hypothetical protein